jgi:hypothetical protein
MKKKKGPDVIQTFPALDWLARLSAHIPNKWEQMVHYYGWYSNRLRGERKKTRKSPAESVPVPQAGSEESEAESEFKKETGSPTAPVARRHWARLIKKKYQSKNPPAPWQLQTGRHSAITKPIGSRCAPR